MSETARIIIEMVFNCAYLIVVWWLVIAMWLRRTLVSEQEQPVARLVMWAFFWLGLGDIGHVGFRVIAFARDGIGTTISVIGKSVLLAPMGSVATAITFTFFYIILLMIWHARFKRPYGLIGTAVFVLGAVRLLIMILPANNWNSLQPPYDWAIYRNVPLMLMQLAVASLIFGMHVPSTTELFSGSAFWS